jgi:hypothetical protein
MSTSVTFHLRGEISTATNFEAESLVLSYCILIPNGKFKKLETICMCINKILPQTGAVAMKTNFAEQRTLHK